MGSRAYRAVLDHLPGERKATEGMRRVLALCVLVLLVVLAASCRSRHSRDEPAFVTDRPLYASLSLDKKSAKTLLLAFDETEGPGEGYNLLYADTNLNGDLSDEKPLQPANSPGREIRFQEFRIPMRAIRPDLGDSGTCTFRVSRGSSGPMGMQDETLVRTTLRVRKGGSEWTYSIDSTIDETSSRRKSSPTQVLRAPKIMLNTQLDPSGKAHRLVTASIGEGLAPVPTITKDGREELPRISLVDRDGRMHFDQPVDLRPPANVVSYTPKDYSVPLTGGDCTIRVSLDTGPIFGRLESDAQFTGVRRLAPHDPLIPPVYACVEIGMKTKRRILMVAGHSAGDGKGYDTLAVDLGAKGQFRGRYAGRRLPPPKIVISGVGGRMQDSYYGPAEFAFPAIECQGAADAVGGLRASYRILVRGETYTMASNTVGNQLACLVRTIVGEGSDQWTYTSPLFLQSTTDGTAIPVVRYAIRKPTLSVYCIPGSNGWGSAAVPGTGEPSNTLTPGKNGWGDVDISTSVEVDGLIMTIDGPKHPASHLIVRRRDGTVVKADTINAAPRNPSQYPTAWMTSAIHVPSGQYTVEASIDTGPLAGVLKATQSFTVK